MLYQEELAVPTIDLDAAGTLLVAEIEDYLRQVAPPTLVQGPGPIDLARLLAMAPPPNPHGSVQQAWNAAHPLPPVTLMDRLRGRRPALDVSPSEHLQLTARYITHHGWAQGVLWTGGGEVCVLGAQLRVLAAGYGTADTIRRARQRLGNELGYMDHPMPVDTFNDLPTTTRHDVHRLLERAAAR
jgi:hypothetical protein